MSTNFWAFVDTTRQRHDNFLLITRLKPFQSITASKDIFHCGLKSFLIDSLLELIAQFDTNQKSKPITYSIFLSFVLKKPFLHKICYINLFFQYQRQDFLSITNFEFPANEVKVGFSNLSQISNFSLINCGKMGESLEIHCRDKFK